MCGQCESTIAADLLQHEMEVENKALVPLQNLIDVRSSNYYCLHGLGLYVHTLQYLLIIINQKHNAMLVSYGSATAVTGKTCFKGKQPGLI